jgi:hypothetical protein
MARWQQPSRQGWYSITQSFALRPPDPLPYTNWYPTVHHSIKPGLSLLHCVFGETLKLPPATARRCGQNLCGQRARKWTGSLS